MEAVAVLLLVLAERARPDLPVRRAWAALGVPRPGLPVRVPVPVALAGLDARRLLLRLTTLGLLYLLLRRLPPSLAPTAYDGVNSLVGLGWAFVGLLVLAVVAATSGRDRGQELLLALPREGRSRVLGWSLLLVGAGLLEYALVLIHRYVPARPPYADLLPNAWELMQGPLLLVGGGLLGLLAARVLPGWVAAPVCVVVSVLWVVVVAGTTRTLVMLTPVVEWVEYHEDARVLLLPGSFGWHNAFLAGLCGLGVLAALLREPGPRRGLLLGGAGVVAATAVAGALALP